MSGIERSHVEIFVHTSAPSRGEDDARYRALAQAYLDFEPANRMRPDDPTVDVSQGGHTDILVPESQASYRPDDEPETVSSSNTSSEGDLVNQQPSPQAQESTDLSFSSVLDNVHSPVIQQLLVTRSHFSAGTQTQNSSDSWQPPPSTIADSQPEDNLTTTASDSPTKVLERYFHQMESSKVSSFGPSPRNPDESTGLPNASMHDNPSLRLPVAGISTAPSEISSLSPLGSMEVQPDAPRGSGKSIPYSQDSRDALKICHFESSSDPAQTSSGARKQQVINVFGSQTLNATRPSLTQPIDKTLAETAIQSKRTALASAPTQPSQLSSSFKVSYASVLEIRPPPPAISMSPLTTDMLRTPSLGQLERKMPLHILYRPQHQTRDLRDLERGYWLIRCETWKEELRKRAWDCLGNFIAKGQAGWAVWCVREEDFGTVRVYCWGAIVGYIYLLLYMASENKIKGSSACWIGGDGQVVVTMPSQ